MTDAPQHLADPELPLEDDELDETFELEPHYTPGVDVALVWTDKAMDHWAWLWGLIDKTKVGVRVLVAGERDWHASKYSTVNGSRAVPRKAMPLSTNPVTHHAQTDDPCLLTRALPIQSAWKKKVYTMIATVAVSVVVWVGMLPFADPDFALVMGLEHGVLLGLWLCSFYGWRVRGPVSYAKFVLQIRAPWVLSPWQLYREIERRNERMGL